MAQVLALQGQDSCSCSVGGASPAQGLPHPPAAARDPACRNKMDMLSSHLPGHGVTAAGQAPGIPLPPGCALQEACRKTGTAGSGLYSTRLWHVDWLHFARRCPGAGACPAPGTAGLQTHRQARQHHEHTGPQRLCCMSEQEDDALWSRVSSSRELDRSSRLCAAERAWQEHDTLMHACPTAPRRSFCAPADRQLAAACLCIWQPQAKWGPGKH